tara:strand:- start:488 stop:979 length:492 start_codon:yes stop_codon:yes gene_type:complete
MRWAISHRFDKAALPLADRHYNRQKPGTPQFVAPGRNVVLLSTCRRALWVTRVQRRDLCKHAWPGAWECSLFRNEGAGLSSELILEAIAATRWMWGDPPDEGMITFVNRAKVKSKKNPGYCYIIAGFTPVGRTKMRDLHTLHIDPTKMPPPSPPVGAELKLFG